MRHLVLWMGSHIRACTLTAAGTTPLLVLRSWAELPLRCLN
jgi:hypothetical protein